MPYQVQVYLAVAPEPSLGPRLQADLSATLAARIEAVIGPAWNVSVSAPPAALGEAMLHGLAELPGDRVPLPAAEVDKVLLVAVTPAPGGLTVAARDFDVRTRTLSPAVVRPVWQPGVLGDAVLDALVTAFAPLGQIDRWEKDVVFIRAKASALPLGDRRLAMFREGDVLRPIVRYNDREGRFRRAAAAQWSFCVVEKVSPEEIKCRVHTGMRGEVVSRGRGRVEPLVLRVVPLGGSTLLAIQSRTEPKRPLAGYDIYSYPPGQKTAVTRVGRTDRQGQLLIPPADAPLRVLLVRSGNEVLARLPMVPGLEPRLTAEISNDDQRLAAEGFITGLQEELVDVFARRKILMMRIRAAIEAKQFDRASELFDELRRLPTGEQFAARVEQGAGETGLERCQQAAEDQYAVGRHPSDHRQTARSARNRGPGAGVARRRVRRQHGRRQQGPREERRREEVISGGCHAHACRGHVLGPGSTCPRQELVNELPGTILQPFPGTGFLEIPIWASQTTETSGRHGQSSGEIVFACSIAPHASHLSYPVA